VRIVVTDTGMGIPPENLDKIFEPFFTTKELNKGTGLGLSTVIAIVKSHKGLINVYSEQGKGTVFHVCFPAMETSEEGRKEQLEEVNPPRGHGETVLLADDEASIRTVTGQTLQAFGYRVMTASDGAEALALYAQHQDRISAVITDMRMPVLGGAAMIQALMRINPGVRVIATSGLDTNEGLAQYSGVAVKQFLTKPYTAATLLKTLRVILDEK
jgi:CheY-like chemotaxis protein